jgi:hypothetical protein
MSMGVPMQRIYHRGRWLAVVVTIVVAAVLGITTNPAAAAGPPCTIVYTSPDAWNWNGGFQADITLTNDGGPIDGWLLEWQFTAGQQVATAFNAQYTQGRTWVFVTPMSYNSTLPAGGSVTITILASRGATNPPPSAFYLNFAQCYVAAS